jgi:hypothetical protein
MPRLKLLDLRETRLDTSSLATFASGFPALRYLFVPADIPDAALEPLRQGRPELWVESEPKGHAACIVDFVRDGDPDFAVRYDELARLLPEHDHWPVLGNELQFFALARARRMAFEHGDLANDRTCARLRTSPFLETLVVRPDIPVSPPGVISCPISCSLFEDHLSEFKSVRFLSVEFDEESPALVLRLAKLPRLECLWRAGNESLSDEEAAALRKLPALKRLVVSEASLWPDPIMRQSHLCRMLPGVDVVVAENLPAVAEPWPTPGWLGPQWHEELRGETDFPLVRHVREFQRTVDRRAELIWREILISLPPQNVDTSHQQIIADLKLDMSQNPADSASSNPDPRNPFAAPPQ